MAPEVTVDVADIDAHEDAVRLQIAVRARLPVAQAEDAEIVAFRSPESADEHVALVEADGVAGVGEGDGLPARREAHRLDTAGQ